MAFWQGSQEIREVSGESFKALATEAARKLDLLVVEEIAHTAVYIVENDFFTGRCLDIDGGLRI